MSGVTVNRLDEPRRPYEVTVPVGRVQSMGVLRLTRAEAYELSAQLLLAFAAEAKGIAAAADLSPAERDELAADRAYDLEPF